MEDQAVGDQMIVLDDLAPLITHRNETKNLPEGSQGRSGGVTEVS
jgi:hypothetical protein